MCSLTKHMIGGTALQTYTITKSIHENSMYNYIQFNNVYDILHAVPGSVVVLAESVLNFVLM